MSICNVDCSGIIPRLLAISKDVWICYGCPLHEKKIQLPVTSISNFVGDIHVHVLPACLVYINITINMFISSLENDIRMILKRCVISLIFISSYYYKWHASCMPFFFFNPDTSLTHQLYPHQVWSSAQVFLGVYFFPYISLTHLLGVVSAKIASYPDFDGSLWKPLPVHSSFYHWVVSEMPYFLYGRDFFSFPLLILLHDQIYINVQSCRRRE